MLGVGMVWRQRQSYSEDLPARVLAAIDSGMSAPRARKFRPAGHRARRVCPRLPLSGLGKRASTASGQHTAEPPHLAQSDRNEDLRLVGLQGHIQRGGRSLRHWLVRVIEVRHWNRPGGALAGAAAIAVSYRHAMRPRVDVAVHQDRARETLRARVGNDEHLAIGENARERHDAACAEGVAEIDAVAADFPEVYPPKAQSRLARSQRYDSLNVLERSRPGVECVKLAPQRLAGRLVGGEVR